MSHFIASAFPTSGMNYSSVPLPGGRICCCQGNLFEPLFIQGENNAERQGLWLWPSAPLLHDAPVATRTADVPSLAQDLSPGLTPPSLSNRRFLLPSIAEAPKQQQPSCSSRNAFILLVSPGKRGRSYRGACVCVMSFPP